MPWADTAGVATAQVNTSRALPSTERRILDRIESLRRDGRRRRLFTQLPLLISGIVATFVGAALCSLHFTCLAKSRGFSVLLAGFVCMHLGPWLMALSLRPVDTFAVSATISSCLVMLMVGGSGSLVIMERQLRERGSHYHWSMSLLIETIANSFWLAGAVLSGSVWSYALYVHLRRDVWARLTLRRLWWGMATFQCAAAMSYSTLSIIDFYESHEHDDRPPNHFHHADAHLLLALAAEAALLGALSLWEPLQMHVGSLLARIGENVSAAGGIAELIGDHLSQKELLEMAVGSFRAVRLDRLKREHLTPPHETEKRSAVRDKQGGEGNGQLNGGWRKFRRGMSTVVHPEAEACDNSSSCGQTYPIQPVTHPSSDIEATAERFGTSLLGKRNTVSASASTRTSELTTRDASEAGTSTSQLLDVSEPATFGDVDVFISHSWSDDPDTKWRALQEWRARFVMRTGREPRAWVDRVCIDQKNISAVLPCLPLFLAGCGQLLALHGPTYFQRLWCVLEMHVFHQMGGSTENILFVPLCAPAEAGIGADGSADVTEAARPVFDARLAETSNPEDKARLLAVIEAGADGINTFNAWVVERMCEAIKARSRLTVDRDSSSRFSFEHAARVSSPSPGRTRTFSSSFDRRTPQRPSRHLMRYSFGGVLGA